MKLQLLHKIDTPVVRKWWVSMETNTNPFFQYDYMSYIWKQVKYFSLYSPQIACIFSEQSEPLMILPLKLDIFKRNYKMLADIQGCGQADALFNPRLSKEECQECVTYFYTNINNKYKLNRLPEDSLLLKTSQGAHIDLQNRVCVKINFPQGAEDLLKSLSKSVRQNIRTAYNRMNRDGVKYSLYVCQGKEMTKDIWQEMMKVYLNRLFTKHKTKARNNPLYRYTHYWKYRYIKHDTKSLQQLTNSFHAILYGNGQIMGFLSGMISQDGTELVVPRLAIDSNFHFYSPGYVLLAETLRWLDANTTCRCLDLSRGDEQYKMDMGGSKILYSFHRV